MRRSVMRTVGILLNVRKWLGGWAHIHGEFGALKAWVLLVTLAALLGAVPAVLTVKPRYEEPYQAKLVNPLKDNATVYPPESHGAKLTFRLTVPFLGHLLGIDWPHTRALLCALGTTMPLIVLLLARRLGLSHYGVMMAGAFATSSAAYGISVQPVTGFYDSMAWTLVGVTALTPRPIAALTTYAALWADERALVAMPCVLLARALQHGKQCGTTRREIWALSAESVPLLVAGIAYGISRQWLAARFQLHTSHAGVGLEVLARTLKLLPISLLLTFKGALLPLGAATIAWRRERHPVFWTLYLASLTTILASSCIVSDVSRSLSYGFLLIPVSLKLAPFLESPGQRVPMQLAVGFSILFPSYELIASADTTNIRYILPLPILAAKVLFSL